MAAALLLRDELVDSRIVAAQPDDLFAVPVGVHESVECITSSESTANVNLYYTTASSTSTSFTNDEYLNFESSEIAVVKKDVEVLRDEISVMKSENQRLNFLRAAPTLDADFESLLRRMEVIERENDGLRKENVRLRRLLLRQKASSRRRQPAGDTQSLNVSDGSCDFPSVSTNQVSLCQDFETDKDVDDWLACKECDEHFSSHAKLRRHRPIHLARQLACTECDKSFAHQSFLEAHVRRAHRKEDHQTTLQRPTFQCPTVECGKIFRYRSAFQQHLAAHSNERNFKCHICEQQCKTAAALKQHSQTHSLELSCVCDVCGLQLKSKSSLFSHKATHEAKTHICDECGHSFATKRYLENHINMWHKKIKKYKCDQCDKAFVKWDKLSDHKRCHSGEKPFLCQECGKTFRKRDSLRQHTRHVHLKLPLPASAVKRQAEREAARVIKEQQRVEQLGMNGRQMSPLPKKVSKPRQQLVSRSVADPGASSLPTAPTLAVPRDLGCPPAPMQLIPLAAASTVCVPPAQTVPMDYTTSTAFANASLHSFRHPNSAQQPSPATSSFQPVPTQFLGGDMPSGWMTPFVWTDVANHQQFFSM